MLCSIRSFNFLIMFLRYSYTLIIFPCIFSSLAILIRIFKTTKSSDYGQFHFEFLDGFLLIFSLVALKLQFTFKFVISECQHHSKRSVGHLHNTPGALKNKLICCAICSSPTQERREILRTPVKLNLNVTNLLGTW